MISLGLSKILDSILMNSYRDAVNQMVAIMDDPVVNLVGTYLDSTLPSTLMFFDEEEL